MSQGMETFAARLASFDVALKRRTSSAKGAKPITWPHSRPSPAELAHAGFYYKPYETNPDNTACFLCQRALDGWEEDDNPITEHLKHSADCGWAIMMDIQQRSSNPVEIEDPTSTRIVEARRATFGLSWPHDGKRGWVCQSEKMVEAGWYFCPHEESNDLASCAYCKLSLDGWEPKDDPYDEHYRRSSDCSFFVFAQPSGKKTKASKSKKPRASKASRLSTQSTATAVSEAPTVDVDDAMDQSILSQATTKTTKPTKKSTKSKAKSSKAKKEDTIEIGSQIDLDSNEGEHREPSRPKRATRGKKRLSDEMSEDAQGQGHTEDIAHLEPPAKRRATNSRNSVARPPPSVTTDDELMETVVTEEPVSKAEPKKNPRATKKGRSSATRKTSETSAASKASLRSHAPDDSQIDAALEADLERDISEAENMPMEATQEQSSSHGSTKSKSGKKSAASVAPVRGTTEKFDAAEERDPSADRPNEEDELNAPESQEPEAPPVKTKSQKGTGKRKATNNKSKAQEIHIQTAPDAQTSQPSEATDRVPTDPERHDSLVSVEIQVRNPGQESDMEPVSKPAPKKASKKKAPTSKGKKVGKADKVTVEHTEPVSETVPDITRKSEARVSDNAKRRLIGEENAEDDVPEHSSPHHAPRHSKVPPKTAERYSDIPQEQHRVESVVMLQNHEDDVRRDTGTKKHDNHAAPPSLPAPVQKSTPSPSPQSSDAENHPPSTRPSASRPPIVSPSKTVRVPLAASTPSMSPSKRNANTGYLRTSHPWTPVDIEQMLLAGSDHKENVNLNNVLNGVKADLASPEKKMTVEEWIFWNAKNGEERLKHECERLVSLFEKEGGRAMRTLEGIECID